ncbi:PH domain-containing protein [Winogradskyella wichelsiae]|uniref:PH domain-containing protein n=1 Tax=Winogradskyella wichelsiae TaxID=2697007 RepID=UPI0015CA7140|nr:PH domain-containing protein [Winogradskyella wichelsiae]
MTKTFNSKISYGLLIVVFVVFFGSLIPTLIYGGLTLKTIPILLFIALIYALILHMFFNTTYTLTHNILKIKCGFFHYKPIVISEIKEISKSSNIISSPAASFDRIEIKYGKNNEMILSPKDKYKFADFLTRINPRIKNNLSEN